MKTYHIAMVIARYPPTIGGTEIQCRELSRVLARRGHRVSVVTERYDVKLAAFEEDRDVKVYRLRAGGPWLLSSLSFAWSLAGWLMKHPEIELLHAHMLAGPAMAALVLGRWFKKPVIVKTAGAGVTGDIGTSSQRPRGHFKLWLFRLLARWIACPSLITQQELESLGVDPSFIRRIPNGVDTERFQTASADQKRQQRQSLGLLEDGLWMIYAGRWAPGKGVEALLSVMDRARSQPGSLWRLCLLLTQPLSPSQESRLREFGDRVHWAIRVSDPLPYYQASDLAVLLSNNEGISNFLLETMACGLPSLTAPGAAVAPPHESDAWSWIHSSENAEGIVLLMTSLQKNSDALKIRGARARLEALNTFSSEKSAQAYEALYAEGCA